MTFACIIAALFMEAQVPAPKLSGDTWLNTEKPIALGGGKVTVVHFWTFECINCRHNLPIYARWEAAFRGTGLRIVGIHTPELPDERILANVKQFVERTGIDYPVLIDNNGANWMNWRVGVWPSVFLVDRHGNVRDSWVGELNYNGANGEEKLAREIAQLLDER